MALIETVSQPISHGDRWLEVGLSIGIALTPQDTLEEDELFRFADVALYRSKGKQRGTFTFYAEDAEVSAEAERHLAHDMLIAIKARNFDLSCAIRVSEGGATAVQVQPIWNHPTLGRIGTEKFLRVAEQSGLIVPLADWMLRSACSLAKSMPALTLCVPVYPRQFLVSNVPEMLLLALRESGLDPARLELRLERGASRISAERLQADLLRLQGMGVTLVADEILLGDGALATLGALGIDRVVVDTRLQTLLRRQSHPLVAMIDAPDGSASPRGKRVFEIGADEALKSFVLLDEVGVNNVAATVHGAVR